MKDSIIKKNISNVAQGHFRIFIYSKNFLRMITFKILAYVLMDNFCPCFIIMIKVQCTYKNHNKTSIYWKVIFVMSTWWEKYIVRDTKFPTPPQTKKCTKKIIILYSDKNYKDHNKKEKILPNYSLFLSFFLPIYGKIYYYVNINLFFVLDKQEWFPTLLKRI